MSKAYERMQAAEIMYLLENGWRRLPNTTPGGSVLWTGLSDKYAYGVTQGYAVNAQKKHDHSSFKPQTIPSTSYWDGRLGPTRRLVAEVTEKGAVHYEAATIKDFGMLGEEPRAEAEAQRTRADELEEKAGSLEKQLLARDKQLVDTEVELATERSSGTLHWP